MSPSAPGGLPASDGSAHTVWQGQSGSGRSTQGLSPGGKQLEIHEPPVSSGWDFSLGAHLDEEGLQCGCRRCPESTPGTSWSDMRG